MPRISWGDTGARFYEIGVDRGVLYPPTGPGVAWNGLTAVNESPSGGEERSFYLDGVMYLQIPAAEEFEGTVEAFTYPDEFAQCDGSAQPFSGLFVTRQPRRPFGLSYRTYVGNDSGGMENAYKIHIIYNALAAPSNRGNATVGDSMNPSNFSWNIKTKPAVVPGYKNTAHLVIRSDTATPRALSTLEDMLYGTPDEAARLPTPAEILNLFEFDFGIIVTDNGNGTFTVTAPGDVITFLDATTFQITAPSAVFIDADSYTISSA